MGPWTAANETSTSNAAELIITAVQALEPRGVLVTSEAVAAEGHYVRLQLPGKYGDLPSDELEFFLFPDSEKIASRADNGSVLVTFRSCAGGVKFIYPFMTPLGDGDLQRQRLRAVRERLGWPLVGCELVECYQYE